MEEKIIKVYHLELTTDDCVIRGIIRADDIKLEKEITFKIGLLPSDLRTKINDLAQEIFNKVDK